MDVYPTRRSCGYPESVNGQTRANATQAKLTADGQDNLVQAVGGGFPFPIPNNGAEAVWNHRLRWQGEGRIEHYQTNFINPDGSFYSLAQDQWVTMPFASSKVKLLRMPWAILSMISVFLVTRRAVFFEYGGGMVISA
jgi:hypothetical protein